MPRIIAAKRAAYHWLHLRREDKAYLDKAKVSAFFDSYAASS
jgi:hypothetical protein